MNMTECRYSRSIVECKVVCTALLPPVWPGYSRSIVECKGVRKSTVHLRHSTI